MSHDHNFARDATGISWNEEKDTIMVHRQCNQSVHTRTEVQVPSGQPSFHENACNATKQEVYKVRSIIDRHDHHDEPDTHSVTVLDEENPNNGMHVNELDDVPSWIDEAVERAHLKARDVEARYFMCRLSGPEISMAMATNDTEYTVILTRIDKRITE